MQKSKIYTINNDLLTKLEGTTINEGVFVEIRIHVREGEIVATGSERKQCGRYDVEGGDDVSSEFH